MFSTELATNKLVITSYIPAIKKWLFKKKHTFDSTQYDFFLPRERITYNQNNPSRLIRDLLVEQNAASLTSIGSATAAALES